MEDEKLIELVRKYEFLYNLKHPKYMDTTRKEMAWKEIADQLKQSAAACKERWQNLRDAYRRALSKKKGKSRQAAKNTKPWKYENEMAFVVPFFVKRKLQESLEIKSDEEESDNYVDDQYHTIAPFFVERKSQESVEIKIEHEVPDDGADDHYHTITHNTTEMGNANTRVDDPAYNSSNNNDHSENSDTEKKLKATKRKIMEPEITASAILMARLLDDKYKYEKPREHNELDSFFLTISDTVKKFSPYLQAVAKNKIFTLVSEMELEQLAPSATTSTQ